MVYDLTKDPNFQSQPLTLRNPAEKDYCGSVTIDTKNVIGVCEIQGRRAEQQDALAVQALPEFKTLSSEQQSTALYFTFQNLEQDFTAARVQGSTACHVTTWQQDNKLKVTTANLGDSTAFIVVLENDKITYSKRINRLHHPSDVIETRNILLSGGTIVWNRLGGSLAVSRAFGDNGLTAINHVPDIIFDEVSLNANSQALVIVACDGLDEALTEAKIYETVRTNKNHPPHEIAQALVTEAYNSGSQDNISVAVIPTSTASLSATIFDGHGGQKVAQMAGTNFYTELERQIRLVKDPEEFNKRYHDYQKQVADQEQLISSREENLKEITRLAIQNQYKDSVVEIACSQGENKFNPPRITITANDIETINKIRRIAYALSLNFSDHYTEQEKIQSISLNLHIDKLPSHKTMQTFFNEVGKLSKQIKKNRTKDIAFFKDASGTPEKPTPTHTYNLRPRH